MNGDEILLSLIRVGLGHGVEALSADVDWQDVHERARHHGVTAIAMDGILASGITLPREELLSWMMDTVNIESAYARGVKVIEDLAAEYQQAGIPLMIIKGYGLSLDYPVPNHRPTGDIDTWNFGRQEEADRYLAEKSGMDIDNGVHHHSVFLYKGMMVENHYDFLNVHSHRSNARMEKLLKAKAAEPGQCVPSEQVANLYFPSADFNALYLLRHLAAHFAAEKVNLRQVLDWGVFMDAHHREIDLKALTDVAEEYNMDRFLACIIAICVSEFGFNPGSFPCLTANPELTMRILDDILDTASSAPEPGLIHIGQRVRRWRKNAWKHRIVYNESLFGTFLTQTAAHLMKPASFNH